MWKYIFSTDKPQGNVNWRCFAIEHNHWGGGGGFIMLYLYVLNAHPFVSNMSKNKQKLYVVIIILRLQNIKP